MTVKEIEVQVETLIREGKIEEAADLLKIVWEEYETELPKSLAALLDRLSEKSLTAAYIKAYHLVDEDRAEAERLFIRASASEKAEVSCAACMTLVGINLERGHEDQALAYLTQATDKQYPPAIHFLALAYVQGQLGLSKDADKAVRLLRGIVDDLPEAKVNLARIIMSKEAKAADIDPFKLLAEAAADGEEEAMMMLMSLGAGITNAPDGDDLILPYVVVPDGMKRPKLVRDAILNEFNISKGEAEEFTASLYGYDDWAALLRVATDPKTAKGKFDEDLEPAELNERHRLLASVICSHVQIEDYIADIVVDLLKPTARSGRPSLKRLAERVDRCMVPIGSRTLSGGIDRIVDQLGVGGDFEKAIRTARPARADVWIEMLSSHLGWNFEEVDMDANADGAWIARTRSKDGTPFEVFISRASFTPGDKGDEHVFEIQKEIEARATKAILLFSKPLVHFPNPKKDAGSLFGGLLHDSGKWTQFVLRPEGGIDDAISQKLDIEAEMDPSVVEPYIFNGAGSMGRCIACYSNDVDPSQETGYVPFGTINGWTNFVPPDVAHLMRAMR